MSIFGTLYNAGTERVFKKKKEKERETEGERERGQRKTEMSLSLVIRMNTVGGEGLSSAPSRPNNSSVQPHILLTHHPNLCSR